MYNHQLYLLYWLISSLVLYVFGNFFPTNVILDASRFAPIESAFYSGFWMTFIVWIMWDYILARRAKLEPEYVAFTYFLIANIFGVFSVTRFSHWSGTEVSNLAWIIILALSANIVQQLVRDWRFSKF